VLAFPRVADATVARALSVRDLVASSTAVVRGTVLDADASDVAGSIVTVVQIEVADVYAGDAPSMLTIVEPGGTPAGSDLGMTVVGGVHYEPGEEVVVFATPARGPWAAAFPGAYRTTGLAQGKWSVVRDAHGAARVERDLSGMTRLAPGAGGWRAVDGVPLQDATLDELISAIVSPR